MIRYTANFILMCNLAHCPAVTAEIRYCEFRDGTGYVGLYDIKGFDGLTFLVERVKRGVAEYYDTLVKLYNENHKEHNKEKS